MQPETNPRKIYLKFDPDIPTNLANALMASGFSYYGRKKNKWVIYYKVLDPKPVHRVKVWEKDLEEKLNKIVDSFLDPYSHLGAIKSQIITMSKRLVKEQETFCLNWMAKNVDNDFYTPPWENADHQPNLGFC